LPPNPPYAGAKAGGIGTGTLWFALGQDGRVIQRRIGPHDKYTEVVIAAGRMTSIMSLSPEVLDDEGDLVVEIFDNSPSHFGGASYGGTPINVTGKGGIRLVGGGCLILNGRSDFSGGVTVDSGELVAESENALGTGDVEVRGGALTLKRAALSDKANLRVSDALQDGTIHLGFSGRDIIHSLQIGDAVHRCGTWGSLDSGAMFTDSLFSGPGILHLAAEPIEGCTTNRTN
jgi:autotransporter-associated beta strand protein